MAHPTRAEVQNSTLRWQNGSVVFLEAADSVVIDVVYIARRAVERCVGSCILSMKVGRFVGP